MNQFKIILVIFCLSLFGLAACDDASLIKDRDNQGSIPEQNRISLERHWQTIIRKDCAGKIISKKWSTVKKAKGSITIKPDKKIKNLVSEFYNRRTKDSATLVKKNGTKIPIYLSKAFFTMQVAKGENIIEYRFFECAQYDKKNKTCDVTGPLAEEGTVTIWIDYKEVNHPEPQTIIECKN